MANMSDGKSDGIIIMYCKDGTVYPVGLTKDQFDMLDLSIGAFMQGSLKVFKDKPIGKITNIK